MRICGLMEGIRLITTLKSWEGLYQFCFTVHICRKRSHELYAGLWLVLHQLFNRTASWTGVNYLYKFLVNNRGAGPFAEEVDISDVRPGDIAQLSFADSKHFNHSPVVVKVSSPPSLEGILVAAHRFDTDYYRLADFEPAYVRFLHIAGVRV